MADNPAVEVAKERREEEQGAGEVTLATGVRARLIPVSASLIDEVRARIAVPKVPTWHNPDTDRDEDNPADPAYAALLAEYDRLRGEAVVDAIIEFGVQLLDPLPEDGRWIKRLKRHGIDVDTSDPDEIEFAYKKYIAAGSRPVLDMIIGRSSATGAAVERAARTF